MRNSEIGTWIDGMIATEAVDSTGEIIDIKGIDISSIFDNKDASFNYEHKSDLPSQIVGKLVFAKKILKKSDCENKRHEHYWKMNREQPYLYGYGVLFDKLGHTSAKDVAVLFSFSGIVADGEEGKADIGFSIEGSRLQKEGNVIKKCILRSCAITQRPANKTCLAEKLTDEQADELTKPIAKKKVEDSMKKSMQIETDLTKTEEFEVKAPKKSKKLDNPVREGIVSGLKKAKKYYTGLYQAKPNAQPKKDFTPVPAGEVGTKTGTGVSEKRPGEKPNVISSTTYRNKKPLTGAQLYRDKKFWDAPDDKPYRPDTQKSEELKSEALQILANDAWDNFQEKETLLASIKKTQPEIDDQEILAIAKTYAYIQLKKSEAEMKDLFEKSKSPNKAPAQKQLLTRKQIVKPKSASNKKQMKRWKAKKNG